MSDSIVNKLKRWLPGVNHEAIGELHTLGTSSTQFARNDNLTTFRTTFHDKTKNTIAGTTDSHTPKELVSERLALSDRGQTTGLDLFRIKLDGILTELEALLDEGSKLTNTPTLLAQYFLGVSSADDDLCKK